MLKFTIKLCIIIIALSSFYCKKKSSKVAIRTVYVLDGSDFPEGSKVGFTCKKFQPPMLRKNKKVVTMRSNTILSNAQITISGETHFLMTCTRNPSGDKGDVVPPDEVQKESEAAESPVGAVTCSVDSGCDDSNSDDDSVVSTSESGSGSTEAQNDVDENEMFDRGDNSTMDKVENTTTWDDYSDVEKIALRKKGQDQSKTRKGAKSKKNAKG